MAERMVKNPGFFEIKHFANTSGTRLQVVSALADRLGVREDSGARAPAPNLLVSNVLAVVSNLVSRVRRLDNFTQNTGSLPPRVLAIRDELLRAVEPDELLFETLPEALNLPPVDSGEDDYAEAENYATEVSEALEALEAVSDRSLAEALDLLTSSGGAATREAVIERAASLEPDVLDSTIRPFVLALANDGTDDNLAWMRTIATVVAQKSPAEWTDEDMRRFQRTLPAQMSAFERLLALYTDPSAGQRKSYANSGRDSPETQGHGEDVAALSVTVTRADGREHARIVHIQPDQRDDIAAVMEKAVREIEKLVGSGDRAQNALLAMIGERVMEGSEHE